MTWESRARDAVLPPQGLPPEYAQAEYLMLQP